MSLPGAELLREVRAHSAILGCDPQQAKAHLLANLGHLGLNLGCYPQERYVAQVTRFCNRLFTVLGE